jgi:hypothetical protein
MKKDHQFQLYIQLIFIHSIILIKLFIFFYFKINKLIQINHSIT